MYAGTEGLRCNIPLGAIADPILHNLGLGNRADFFEKLLKFASAQTGSQLLHEHGATITLVLGQGLRSTIPGPWGVSAAAAVVVTSTVAVTTVAAIVAPGPVVAVRGARSGAASAASVVVSISVTA